MHLQEKVVRHINQDKNDGLVHEGKNHDIRHKNAVEHIQHSLCIPWTIPSTTKSFAEKSDRNRATNHQNHQKITGIIRQRSDLAENSGVLPAFLRRAICTIHGESRI